MLSVPGALSRRAASSICLACRRDLRRNNFFTSAKAAASGSTATGARQSPQSPTFQSYPLASPSTTTAARNAAVPESSIARAPRKMPTLPEVHETRPPAGADGTRLVQAAHRDAQQQQAAAADTAEVGAGDGAPTAAAVSATPIATDMANRATTSTATTAATAEAAPATAVTPAKRNRLRPRKAAMRLTPAAVAHLRKLLDSPTPQLIRVGVRNRGCSGLQYSLEFVDKPAAFDEAIEQDGVRVLIDSKALFSIIGSEMDWIEDKLSQRFVFNNPNIKEQCGCGESFSV